MVDPPQEIWAISDGRAGMRNQALGLGEAIARKTGAVVVEQTVKIRQPWDSLPERMWGDPWRVLSDSSARLRPPFPPLVVACGRRTVPFTAAMTESTFTVQTQDPRWDPAHFSLVVPPEHDGLEGGNVFPIIGSPNRLTVEKLARVAGRLAPLLPDLPRPLAAVLIGGGSKHYRLTPEGVERIAAILREVAEAGYGLLVTCSRRTPAKARKALAEALSALPAWMWDGAPVGRIDNPYLGMLGLAERLYVTEESANMITEAAFTGKPVHLLPLAGGAEKWRRFHRTLQERGVLRPGASPSEHWTYEPLRETERAAEAVLDAYRRAHA